MSAVTEQVPVAITTANDEQLRTFATDVLQLDLAELAANTRAKVIGAIAGSWSNNFILCPKDDGIAMAQVGQGEEPVPVVHQTLTGTGIDDAPKALIKIMQTAMPGGKHPVPVSVNTRQKVIQRNMNVEVPWPYVEALMHAVVGDCTEDPDTHEIIVTEVTNYPISIIRYPDPAELKAWTESVKDTVLV
jgi:hypothetical protein